MVPSCRDSRSGRLELAEDAGDVAKVHEDAVAGLVVRFEKLRGGIGPGATGDGVVIGFFPADPMIGRWDE